MPEGERHLPQPVGPSWPLIEPPFWGRGAVLRAYSSLQFLQTLLHVRGHLQAVMMMMMMKMPLVMQAVTIAQAAVGYEK